MRPEMMKCKQQEIFKTERNGRCTKRKETFKPCLLKASKNINICKEEK